MKTFDELAAWCAGAAEEFGDPSVPVGQLFIRWHQDMNAIKGDEVIFGWHEGELVLGLGPGFPPLPLRIETGRTPIDAGGELVAFGAQRIAAGVWSLTPSLNVQGLIHAFLVLYDVPDPAPWERRIVLP